MRNRPKSQLTLKLHLQANQTHVTPIQKTNFATTPSIQPDVRQFVISEAPNIIYKQTQNDTTGMPSTVWQQ